MHKKTDACSDLSCTTFLLSINLYFSRYKAQGVVEDVTNRIVDHIRPGPYRLDWDSLMTTMDIVEMFEEVKTCLDS